MASRSKARDEAEGELDLGEELDTLEQLIERVKVLYEQHFMGIQKIPPETLHRQAERRMIKLTQLRMRNTAMRFRFTTLSQKFGAYNTYWRRTMRAIQQGTYTRHMQRVAQRAGAQGREIPEEMLLKMPKRLREKLIRDRDRIAERAAREQARGGGAEGEEEHSEEEGPAVVRSARPLRHEIDEASDGGDFDFDAMFDAIKTDEGGAPAKPAAATPPPTPPPTPRPAAARAKPADDLDLDATFDALMSGGDPPTQPTAPPAMPPRPAAPNPAAVRAKEQAKAAAKEQARARAQQKIAAEAAAKPAPPRAAPRAVQVSQKRDSTGNLLPPGMSEQQTRKLYDRYVKAKKLVGEDTAKVSYAKLLRTLNKQAPRIMKQHQAKSVEFNVVIKDDAVVLKAKPKKG